MRRRRPHRRTDQAVYEKALGGDIDQVLILHYVPPRLGDQRRNTLLALVSISLCQTIHVQSPVLWEPGQAHERLAAIDPMQSSGGRPGPTVRTAGAPTHPSRLSTT